MGPFAWAGLECGGRERDMADPFQLCWPHMTMTTSLRSHVPQKRKLCIEFSPPPNFCPLIFTDFHYIYRRSAVRWTLYYGGKIFIFLIPQSEIVFWFWHMKSFLMPNERNQRKQLRFWNAFFQPKYASLSLGMI